VDTVKKHLTGVSAETGCIRRAQRQYECLNPVTGLPTPVRIMCRLTSGKCHHTAQR
jgi:hypothetical protein